MVINKLGDLDFPFIRFWRGSIGSHFLVGSSSRRNVLFSIFFLLLGQVFGLLLSIRFILVVVFTSILVYYRVVSLIVASALIPTTWLLLLIVVSGSGRRWPEVAH